MKTKKNRKNSILFQNRSMLLTFVLLLCIAGFSLLLTLRVDHLTKEQCYSVLSTSTKEARVKIENNFSSDRSSLRILSRVIALEDDLTSNAVNELLTVYTVSSLTSNLAIITSDNTIVQIRGANITDHTIMDFQQEMSLGEHVSGLQPALTASDQNVIRSFVPIKKNSKIIGMLFTEMNPSTIASAWAPEIYDNSASFCVIDRSTGDFIINSWDTSIKNLSDLPSEELAEHIRNRETGFMQLENGKDDLFVSYMPMEMENWEIIVTVQESAVFASANAIRFSQRLFLIAVSVLLALYLFWMIYSNRNSIAATEKQANIDVLTGLQNRNRYEAFCQTLDDKVREFTCIYIDANGLHEINNTRGHLAGDQMLRYIADTLKVAFGEEMVYRIGGDEFVVFQRRRSLHDIEKDMQRVHSEIERNDYHVSAGICASDTMMSVNEMIKTAEKRMYEAKQKYYESIGKQVRNNLNDEKEHT